MSHSSLPWRAFGRTLALLGLVLLGSCSWHGPVPCNTLHPVEQTDDILVMDEAAWNAVAVRNYRAHDPGDGRLEVNVEIANTTEEPASIEVCTRFSEYDGTPLPGSPVWRRMTIPGGDSAVYTATSLDDTAGQFTVEIRTP